MADVTVVQVIPQVSRDESRLDLKCQDLSELDLNFIRDPDPDFPGLMQGIGCIHGCIKRAEHQDGGPFIPMKLNGYIRQNHLFQDFGPTDHVCLSIPLTEYCDFLLAPCTHMTGVKY